MTKEQRELFDIFVDQIRESNTITIHHAKLFLEIALDGVERKSDLSDSEKQDIKIIRTDIKGL